MHVAMTGKKEKKGGKKPDAKQKAAAKEKDRVCCIYMCICMYVCMYVFVCIDEDLPHIISLVVRQQTTSMYTYGRWCVA